VAVLMAVVLVSTPAMAEKKTLKFGVVAWSEALALGALIEYLLVNEIGQDVEIINPDAGVAYTAIQNKELDLYIEAWLPLTHETYWDKVASHVCDFGPIYEDASLGWAVPNYIPKDVLNSVTDMDKDEVKKKCKGRIVGIDPGSGLMQHSALMMKKYPELEGWKLVEGSDAAMVAELKRSMQRKEWIVVTLWRPHHAFARFDIRYIDEPKKILGYEERSHMLGRDDFMSVFPNKVSRFLTRFTMPIAAVDDLTNMYQDNEKTAAPKFIKKYPEMVHYWLTGKCK
jgi:glycine betaine/proline transport system substrate-binding protein